jgi:hypothetical protein
MLNEKRANFIHCQHRRLSKDTGQMGGKLTDWATFRAAPNPCQAWLVEDFARFDQLFRGVYREKIFIL